MEEITQSNWLIFAGKLKPGEYLHVRKGRLKRRDMVAALEKQYPSPMRENTTSLTKSYLDISFHGDMAKVFRPDPDGRIDIAKPAKWQEN